jgi:hypothetical protein
MPRFGKRFMSPRYEGFDRPPIGHARQPKPFLIRQGAVRGRKVKQRVFIELPY